jgi:hypothetical protein
VKAFYHIVTEWQIWSQRNEDRIYPFLHSITLSTKSRTLVERVPSSTMPILSRRTAPLLQKVAGKSHATTAHHEPPPNEGLSSKKDQNIFAEPESSDDETSRKYSDSVDTPSAITEMPKNPLHKGTKRKHDPMKVAKQEESSLFDDTGDVFGNLPPSRARKPTKYGSAKSLQPSKSVKGTLATKRPTAKGKENSSVKGFRSPPTSSPLVPPQVKASFKLPPSIEFKSMSQAASFKQPPIIRPTRSTRSAANFITPETSVADTELSFTDIEAHIATEELEPLPPSLADGLDSSCPTCGVQVSEDLLGQWKARYPQMSIRVQQRFCREHHLQAARIRWEESHPSNSAVIDIDWTGLDHRLQKLKLEMLSLIEKPDQSYYRAEFERSIVDTGGSRTMMKHVIGASRRKKVKTTTTTTTEEMKVKEEVKRNTASISVGYYGTKGLQMMYDHLFGFMGY